MGKKLKSNSVKAWSAEQERMATRVGRQMLAVQGSSQFEGQVAGGNAEARATEDEGQSAVAAA